MKIAVLVSIVALCMTFCSGPQRITANPDKHTATSGTLGSAKMTNTLPERDTISRLKTDTLQRPRQ